MKKTLWIVIIVAAVVLTAGLRIALGRSADFPGAVFAAAEEFGHEREDLETVSGGSSGSLLTWRLYTRFRSRSQPELGEIYVEVERSLPFLQWRLHTYSTGVGTEEETSVR